MKNHHLKIKLEFVSVLNTYAKKHKLRLFREDKMGQASIPLDQMISELLCFGIDCWPANS